MSIDIYLPGYNAWKDADLLERKDQLPHMKSMVLNGSGITDEGLSLLPLCTKLRELHLICTRITNEGLDFISQLNSLDWLVIDEASITDSGIRKLSTLSNLSSLQVVNTGITDDGLEVLFHYPKLQYLEAVSNRIGKKGISIISQQPTLSGLRMASHTISDEEFMELVFCGKLKSLAFDFPLVSRSAYEELCERLPGCDVTHYNHYMNADKFNPLMLHVMELYLEGKYRYALNAINDAVKYNQHHPIVFGFRALTHLKLGSYAGFWDNMIYVQQLAVKYNDKQLKALSDYLLSIKEIMTLQLVIAKERPEEYFMTLLDRVYRKRPDAKRSIVQLPYTGPLHMPVSVRTISTFAHSMTFEERSSLFEGMIRIKQVQENLSNRSKLEYTDYIPQPRPEEVLLKKLKKLMQDPEQRPPEGKGQLPPWEW